jgi:hypothetical protein
MGDPHEIVFEDIDGFAVFRIVGAFAMQAGVHLIRDAIAQARERRISKLMIVITETTGYGIPSLSMRLAMMREWADAAAGHVRVVMVCRPEFIDPNKFGITMAANFGMQAEVFTTEGEALGWLRGLA